MIHLHSHLSSGAHTSAAGQTSHVSLSQATLDSFESALSEAVSATLEKFGIDPSEVKISITPTGTASTTPETTTTSSTAATTTAPATASSSSAAPNGGYDPFLQAAFDNPYKSAPPVSTSASTVKAQTAATDPLQAFDDAYWAKQPTAVRALRNIQDSGQRTTLATQLANEGYSIDVPIMVWGWDPAITTSMRKADGYTWVPSALQNPIEVAPGMSPMGTLAAYDPKNPPSGSIAV